MYRIPVSGDFHSIQKSPDLADLDVLVIVNWVESKFLHIVANSFSPCMPLREATPEYLASSSDGGSEVVEFVFISGGVSFTCAFSVNSVIVPGIKAMASRIWAMSTDVRDSTHALFFGATELIIVSMAIISMYPLFYQLVCILL